jgi:adenine-specific DNA-methyltransferase
LLEDGEINQEYKDIKAKAIQTLLGVYATKRDQLQSIQATEAQKAVVFNHLYNFFSRYYEEGDFIPRRRYGARETYAVPYNGEETLFHWANKDQHYVKTGETFKDYAFTVEGLGGPFRVRFLLSEASLPPGNTKGDTRYFFPLPDEINWEGETKSLNIPFHYRLPVEEEIEKYGKNSRFQEGILRNSLSKILDAVPDSSLRSALTATVEEKEDQNISLLFKRMRHFCKRNTSDYFIHRNLEGFLKHELEFYIKDQVLHLADIEGDLEAKRRTIRVIRQLSEEIITFLAQIENVQKRLFEKKKFVIRTEYLVPIKEVPRELWKEILENKAQLEAWETLFAIDPKKDLFNQKGKINEKFLKDSPTLVVDTSHFDNEFKERLLAHFDNLDEVTDGLLIHSENYQALRFLERKYAEKVKCIYIDPPYNTGNDGFIYKDRYKHSSWLSMIGNRLNLLRRCTSEGGVVFISVDENEHDTLLNFVRHLEGSELIADYIWKGRSGQTGTIKMVSYQHEYVVCFSFDSENARLALQKRMHEGGKFEDTKGTYTREQLRQWGQADRREDRPQMWYGIPNPQNNEEFVFPIKEDGTEGRWRVGKQKAFQLLAGNDLDFVSESGRWQVYKKVRAGTITYSAFGTVLDQTGTTAEGTKVIQDLFGDRVYQYPKPPKLIEFVISIGTGEKRSPYILDFFAGSGTTGHAVINLNREDGGRRRFILVEMADYFYTVLLPPPP